MAPRTLVSAGPCGWIGSMTLLLAACFVDQPRDGVGGSSGVAASETSTAPGSTTGETGTQGTGTTGTTGTTSDPTTGSTTGDPTTTTATTTADPTGSVCAAADEFPNIDPPECRACVATSCCVPVSECAADPACSAAWSCTQNQQCLSEWENCPGYAEQHGRLGTISACAESACPGVCALGPCAAEKAACQQNAECQAVDACVQANCNNPCPAEQPDCFLPCWGMCQEQHPGGAQQWGALIMCYGSKCP